jgi:hypothetical protein
MKKSDLMARFSMHRGMTSNARDAHNELLLLFNEEYPISSFEKWDTRLDEEWAHGFYLRHRDDPDCDMRWLLAGLWQVS